MTHGSEKRARTKHLTIRFTPDERAEVDADAERAALTSGSYARQVLLNAPAPRQVRRPPVERKDLARLLGMMGAIRSSLNQIARVANFGEGIDYPGMQDAFADLNVMRDAVLQALGRDT